mgnify:FL=1
MTHNEAIELLVKEAASSDKKRLTELFLQTLVNGQIHFGLQVLSKMKTFHVHSYSYLNIPKTGDRFKDDRLIAKEYKKPVLERNVIAFEDMPKEQQAEIVNQTNLQHCILCSCQFERNLEEYPYDPLIGPCDDNIYEMLQCLWQENKESQSSLHNQGLQNEGLYILKEVFETIISVQKSDGIRDVFKLLKKKEFFKHWKKEEKRISVKFAELALQRLLEIMGYLSILHTEKYRGSFYEFNEGCTPRSSRSSDWNYPVDFWRGKNGIDKIAFQYWFGEYDELEKFWKQ